MRFRPAWGARANGARTSITASSRTSPRWPSRSQAAFRWARCCAREEASRAIHPGMHGTTFGGGPLACAVAIAVIDAIEHEELLEHIQRRRRLLPAAACTTWPRSTQRIIGRARHGVDAGARTLTPPTWQSRLSPQMLERHILINRTSETVLRFLPPYIIRTQACGSSHRRTGRNFARANAAAVSAAPETAAANSHR